MNEETKQTRPKPSRREAMQAVGALPLAGIAFQSDAVAQNTGGRAGSSLGSRLRGMQHIGVTVQNMNRAFEFYTEVLGGTEVMSDSDFHGEPIHNTLLLREEIYARQHGINSRTIGVPDLRGGAQRLDVRFVQFDNVVIELLQYRDKEQPSGSGDSFALPHERTSPAYPSSEHICFYIKDDADFDQFIQDLEVEAAKRGMTNVRANRTVGAASDVERLKTPLDTNTIKIKEGRSDGWSLMYCKGPEGEQLEFVQVLGPVKRTFDSAYEKRKQVLGGEL